MKSQAVTVTSQPHFVVVSVTTGAAVVDDLEKKQDGSPRNAFRGATIVADTLTWDWENADH